MKVLVQMDEGWMWWPTPEDECHVVEEDGSTHIRHHRQLSQRVNLVEMDEELYERYKKVRCEYSEMQQLLEHLYRHQEGLSPFPDSPFFKVT